uniref:ropporin-1-like isoform X1 n=1 Tax=Oncorhynchus gorbuscha TaxID=8017 RepID=UPI001EAF0663|nr:ropporin-1-like isoform X1 [Oncorhynchus gorbuscha]
MSRPNSSGSGCSHTGMSVHIPQELPDFLLQFTKDAIRAQPEDIIEYSTAYFTAMVKGQPFSVKPNPETKLELTNEILGILHSQLSERETVRKLEIGLIWKSLNMPENTLNHILSMGKFGEEIEWNKFLASCCSYLGKNVKDALTQACYIMNCDSNCKPPDACVSFETFRFLYTYLAVGSENISQSQIDRVLSYLQKRAISNNGVVKVSDFINNRKLRLDPTN